MFNNWLRENKAAMWLLTVVRVYLGYEWMTHGLEKLTGGFDASGFISGALGKTGGEYPAVQGWWGSFLEAFALPNVGLFNVLVPFGEFLVGVGLLIGTLTTFATLMAMVMNFSYLFSGTVSTNAIYLLFEIFLVVAGANAGRIGFDRWVLPFLGGLFDKNKDTFPADPARKTA
jgi:thiosulfate dehydrogenase (quinone) large subunit